MTDYSIWVMEYAYIPEVPISSVIYGAHNKGVRKLPYGYVLIKGRNSLAMVDVGYNHTAYGETLANKFGAQGWQPASVVLGAAGVRPEDVTHVFLTHLHFDHAGNTDAFPNATFYVQERELSKSIWAMSLDSKFRWLNSGTDPGDLLRVVDLARQGRLVSVDGDREDVLPGIDLRAAHDTHTWGCQFVTVRNDGKKSSAEPWVMAGDLAYTYENLHGPDPSSPSYVPVGLAMESQCNLLFATDAMMKEAGGDYTHVLPVHEEGLTEVFPYKVLANGLRISEITLADGEKSLVT